MALTNRDHVGQTIDSLTKGLRAFVVKQLQAHYKDKWTELFPAPFGRKPTRPTEPADLDAQALLYCMALEWNNVFKQTLGYAERSLVGELIDVRNDWAHQKPFSTEDAYRAADSVRRLLDAVKAPEAQKAELARVELLELLCRESSPKQRPTPSLLPDTGQKEASTLDKQMPFLYSGSLHQGVVLKFPSTTAPISASFLRAALEAFADREVEAGFNKTDPPPGGFGIWIKDHSKALNGRPLSPQHGSHIAAILHSEAGVQYHKAGRKLILRFPP